MEIILGLMLFFGLGLAALVVLTLSAIYSRSVAAIILWGLVAIGLMVLECALLTFTAGVGSATSGLQSGYRILRIVFFVFSVSLAIYFTVAFGRIFRRGDR